MHDTFLNQNLYEAITNLCRKNSISKINQLTVTVHTHSHISDKSIREHFTWQNSSLLGDWTTIQINKKNIEPLTATVEQIDGEKS